MNPAEHIRKLEAQLQMLIKDVAEMREVIVALANQLHVLANPEIDNVD